MKETCLTLEIQFRLTFIRFRVIHSQRSLKTIRADICYILFIKKLIKKRKERKNHHFERGLLTFESDHRIERIRLQKNTRWIGLNRGRGEHDQLEALDVGRGEHPRKYFHCTPASISRRPPLHPPKERRERFPDGVQATNTNSSCAQTHLSSPSESVRSR